MCASDWKGLKFSKKQNVREKVITLLDDNTTIASKAKYEAKYGKGLKKFTPKKMLQRLPIALAQVKAGSISNNLQNEVGQIMYSMYGAKGVTKKVYNNIMNS